MKTTKNRFGSCEYSPLTVTDKLYGRSSIFGFFEAALLPKQLRETNEFVLYNFDVSRIPRNVVRTVLVFRARSLGGNRNEKRRGSGCL